MTTLTSSFATSRGLVRELNEDSGLAVPPLFVVADGMGGHAAGDVASRLTVEQFASLPVERLTQADVTDAIDRANAAILGHASVRPECFGMGTTVTGAALLAIGGVEHWMVFNVGDSRVYKYDRTTLQRVTIDHSEVQELLDAGAISESEAAGHPASHVVTRSLGTDPAPSADVWLLPAHEGDWMLVCSDGLTLELSEPEIASILASGTPDQAAHELVLRAESAGGRDNITVIVVQLSADANPETDSATGVGTGLDATTRPRLGWETAGGRGAT